MSENESKTKMITLIIVALTDLFKAVKPRKSLFLAFDGTSPSMKLIEQHSRHFREKKSDSGFDKATNFSTVSEFGHYIQKILADPNLIGTFPGITYVLSNGSVPGEGEMKIKEYITYMRKRCPNDHFGVYTNDSDFFVLSNDVPNLQMILAERITGMSNYSVISMKMLRECLKTEFPNKTHEGKLMNDIKILVMLFKSDFLPGLGMKIKNHLRTVFECYHEMKGYLTNNGRINWEAFSTFLQVLQKRRGKFGWRNSRDMKKRGGRNNYQKKIEQSDIHEKRNKVTEESEEDEKKKVIDVFFDTDSESDEESDEEDEEDDIFDEEIEPIFEESIIKEITNKVKEKREPTREEKHVLEYLRALFWTFHYFCGMNMSWEYNYKLQYSRSPRIHSIIKYLSSNKGLNKLFFEYFSKQGINCLATVKKRRDFFLKKMFFTKPEFCSVLFPCGQIRQDFELFRRFFAKRKEKELSIRFYQRLWKRISEMEFSDESFNKMSINERERWIENFPEKISLHFNKNSPIKSIDQIPEVFYQNGVDIFKGCKFMKNRNSVNLKICDGNFDTSVLEGKLIVVHHPFPVCVRVSNIGRCIHRENIDMFKEKFLKENRGMFKNKYGIVFDKKKLEVIGAEFIEPVGGNKIEYPYKRGVFPFCITKNNFTEIIMEGNISPWIIYDNTPKEHMAYNAILKFTSRLLPKQLKTRKESKGVLNYLLGEKLIKIGETKYKTGLGVIKSRKCAYNPAYSKYVWKSFQERFYYFSSRGRRRMLEMKGEYDQQYIFNLVRKCENLENYFYKESCKVLIKKFVKENKPFLEFLNTMWKKKKKSKRNIFVCDNLELLEKTNKWIEENVRNEIEWCVDIESVFKAENYGRKRDNDFVRMEKWENNYRGRYDGRSNYE